MENMMIRSMRATSLTLVLGSAMLALPAFAAPAPAAQAPAQAQAAPAASPSQTPGTQPGAAPTATATQAAMALTDAEILGLVNTVDQHEVDAAEKALKKKMGKEAQDYARMLKEAHGANLQKTKTLAKSANIKVRTNNQADSLKAKGKADVKAMAAKQGAEFEKAYIDAMVTGHTETLAMIDSQLIPAAQNEAVKSHLTEVRGHVAAHLEQGKRLQGASASAPEAE